MRAIITIEMDGAAFQDGDPEEELARVLIALARDIQSGFPRGLQDMNGNTCGRFEIVED